MNEEAPTPLKSKAIPAVIYLFVLLALVVGLGWWYSIGPFRPQLEEKQDILENVYYIEPRLQYEGFVDFLSPDEAYTIDWEEGDKTASFQKKLEPLLPLLPRFTPKPVQTPLPQAPTEQKHSTGVHVTQELTMSLMDAIHTEGFRVAPPATKKGSWVNSTSVADMEAIVRTYKRDDIVIFRVEVMLTCTIHAKLRKPILLSVNLPRYRSRVYAVEERNAPKKMRDVVRSTAQSMLHDVRSVRGRSYDKRLVYMNDE